MDAELFAIKSPFKHHEEIIEALMNDFRKILESDESDEQNTVQARVKELCSWLCETPNSVTYRVNAMVTSVEKICATLKQHYQQPLTINLFKIPEMMLIEQWGNAIELDLEKCSREVVVDAACGAAVLRGAHVFAPGVMSMPHGLQVNDKVSIFADSSGNCRKGSKSYEDEGKLFLGNGLARTNRGQLFGEGACPSGIAVYVTATISKLPQIGDACVPKGHALLQNLPSIICSRILDPQPGETILDMCAAPGNKTTHLSALMSCRGRLIALEKIKSKIERLRSNCNDFGCTNVEIHCFDSCKAVRDHEDDGDEKNKKKEIGSPPFAKESFDRILLDAPCSGLGRRPQILNCIRSKELRSYVPLQRKLFSVAVKLLKIGGVLVYSTCTVTIAENEGIVEWALRSFPELRLSSVADILEPMNLNEKYSGTSAYTIEKLRKDEARKLLRFGPESETVGFFIARFVKMSFSKG